MPLYIRDDKVDDLVEQVLRATGAKSKTDAVRKALMAQLEAVNSAIPLSDKVKAAQSIAAEIGPADPDFDMKAFTDDAWGDS